jgi:hypothetical protein
LLSVVVRGSSCAPIILVLGGAAKSAEPLMLTVCQLAASPQLYVAKAVRVSAQYESDALHFEFLRDAKCPRSFISVHARHPQPAQKGPFKSRETAVRAVLLSGSPVATVNLFVEGTFEGTFQYVAEARPGFFDYGELLIDDVTILHADVSTRRAPRP